MPYHETVLSAIGQTPLVRLRRVVGSDDATVLAKLEYLNPGGSIKDRMALHIIEKAEKAGLLWPGGTIVENTSGNTGVAVAMTAAVKGYRPYNFLFKVANVRQLLKNMSEATMRLVVGDRSINEVISKRDVIAIEARESLQKELDQAETGIHIVTIEMKKTNVPPSVQPSFNEVNQATQEKEQMIYQANEDYNKAIPTARGEAERTIKSAEGYALNRINRAIGDAARFRDVYEEYRKAKDVTKTRLYLENMRSLLPKLGPIYIVDSDQKNTLPLLNFTKPGGK